MKRVITGTCLAAAFAVGLSAQGNPPQTPPQTPPSQTQPRSQDKDAAKTVTVTGCLKAGDSADSFILSDLKWSRDKSAPVGTSGSAGAPPELASASSLKLKPSASAKLSEHVGHTVEVSGSIDKSSAPSATPPAGNPPSAERSASSGAQTLEVRYVRMISATCSAL
jgi:hypothetical protein